MTEKQGCGDEGETREAREGKQEETQRWVSVRRRGDLGEIQGRSIDLRGSVFRGVGGSSRREGVGVESKVRGQGQEGNWRGHEGATRVTEE